MQVCSPAAEALEGIRYPRVAAVTVRDVGHKRCHDDVMKVGGWTSKNLVVYLHLLEL